MPASLIPILAIAMKALGVLLPLLVVLAPVVLPAVLSKLRADQRARLLAATKGAVLVVAEFATSTPTSIDDQILKVLQAVEAELGRSLKPKEIAVVKAMAKSLHADPRFPARLVDNPTSRKV